MYIAASLRARLVSCIHAQVSTLAAMRLASFQGSQATWIGKSWSPGASDDSNEKVKSVGHGGNWNYRSDSCPCIFVSTVLLVLRSGQVEPWSRGPVDDKTSRDLCFAQVKVSPQYLHVLCPSRLWFFFLGLSGSRMYNTEAS